jgi:L-ascorbate metabolism protein UlaG (beta-lactamase superfamily)
MIINWLGHSCFLITNDNNDTLIIDPYESYVGKEMDKVSSDVVVISHEHKDHCAIQNVNFPKKIIDKMGSFWYNDIKINTFYRYHDNKGGTLRGKTLITKIITNGFHLCHLGDIGEDCSDDIVFQIGKTDILFIPVGGTYTIDSKQAKIYVEKIQPKIVIPMHYKNEYCVFDIDNVEEFLKKLDKANITNYTEKNLLITKEILKKQMLNIILMKLA